MRFRFIIIFCSHLMAFASWSLDSPVFQKLNTEIEVRVNQGKFINALHLCNDLLKKELSENQRYQILITKSKIHYWEENFYAYNQVSKKAFDLKRKKSGIYKAYYYAQKAAFFNYHILGDSAVYYSNKSLFLLHQNWIEREKIPYHFIYQMYGTSILYRPRMSNIVSIKANLVVCNSILNYLDSALLAVERVTHFNQDKALIYRSIGSRTMDVVGYTIRNNKSDFENYTSQIKFSNEAIKAYKKGLNCLDKNDKSLSFGLKSLIALAYYCTNRQEEGDEILWPIINHMETRPLKIINSESIQLLHVLQTFSEKTIFQKKLDPRIYKVMKIYKNLRNEWYLYLLTKNLNYRDTYGASPTTMLSLIYAWLNELKIKSDYSSQLRYSALNNYVYYSQFLRRFIGSETGYSSKSKFILKQLDLKRIQGKLENKEALLIKIEGALDKTDYILVSNNQLLHDINKRKDFFSISKLDLSQFKKFKELAFKNFCEMPFANIFRLKKIKKLYVATDIYEDFDVMLIDTSGNSFEKLNYFKRFINVVRVYNPIDYFTDQKNEIANTVHSYYINEKATGNFPFCEHILKKVFPLSKLKKQNGGISHFIGHGNLKVENDCGFKTNELQSKEFKRIFNFRQKIKPELLVFNFCFGSKKRITFYPDRDLQNQFINKGYKSVIASSYESIDQSSAFIFKKFYRYLKRGITVEDALNKAKLDYLKSHKGSLAHPIYWSTYELTTNVKNLHIKPINKEHSILFPALLTFSGVIVAFILLFVKPFTK